MIRFVLASDGLTDITAHIVRLGNVLVITSHCRRRRRRSQPLLLLLLFVFMLRRHNRRGSKVDSKRMKAPTINESKSA